MKDEKPKAKKPALKFTDPAPGAWKFLPPKKKGNGTKK